MKTLCAVLLAILTLSPTPETLAQESKSEADRPLEHALTIVQSRYAEPMSREQVVDRALRALLKDLDPYSSYLDPREWARFEAQLKGEFGGVGAQFAIDAEAQLPRVRRLMIGSPAGAAGVRPGDLIEAIDGVALKGKSLDQVVPLVVGTPDSPVELAVRRGAEVSRVRVRRKIIKTPSVRGVRRDASGEPEYLFDAAHQIGYIRISRLAEDTVPAVERALAALTSRGVKGLILDLRDSQGGLMDAAVGVADLFLEHGRVLSVTMRGETKHYDAQPGGYTDLPMIVLINSGTASSSEFLAAALQDNKRAVFVGQRTFGKGRIQEKLSLGEGMGGVILTTGTYQRPSGKAVDRHDAAQTGEPAGVAPDPGMEFVLEREEYEQWEEGAFLRDLPLVLDESGADAPKPDRMLDHAVQILKELGRR